MKPFDLERAKAGDPIVNRFGEERFFVGIGRGDKNLVVCDSEGNLKRLLPNGMYRLDGGEWAEDIFMVPRKRTVWVNLYPSHRVSEFYYTEEEADADQWDNPKRLADKAYSIEIEE